MGGRNRTRRESAPVTIEIARALSRLIGVLLAVAGCARPDSTPRSLECHVRYADTLQTLAVDIASNPYAVPVVPIHGRFAFRAVYVTEPKDLAGLDIYVYQTAAPRHTLIHQLELRPPYYPSGKRRFGITGLNLVYDERARELQYWCGFANKGAR